MGFLKPHERYGCRHGQAGLARGKPHMSGWLQRPLSEIGTALREGDVSAVTLLNEARLAHARNGRGLDAYRTWDEARALERAKAADAAFKDQRDLGPLQGIPFSAKDLFGVQH